MGKKPRKRDVFSCRLHSWEATHCHERFPEGLRSRGRGRCAAPHG
jgi:hypothetical protein